MLLFYGINVADGGMKLSKEYISFLKGLSVMGMDVLLVDASCCLLWRVCLNPCISS